jgi:RHS repeat-associated protein
VFKYNQTGLRTKKISGETTTEYTYAGGLLMSQTDGTNTLNYVYSAGGTMLGVQYNGVNYYYLRNLQGDVTGIYDSSGNVVANYLYNTWGAVISVTDADGNAITDPTHIGNMNPIRYRGYYYDTETGYYYLESRYYNPEWGRFLNADALFIAGSSLTGANMFAYCLNNPVMHADPCGENPFTIIIIAFGIIIGAVAFKVFQKETTPAERKLVRKHPIDAAKVFYYATVAEAETKSRFGGMDDGAKSNAFLHAYWSALLSYHLDPGRAAMWTAAHENYGDWEIIYNDVSEIVDTYGGYHSSIENIANLPKDFTAMDLYNNLYGISIGMTAFILNTTGFAEATNTQLADSVYELIENNTLYWFK